MIRLALVVVGVAIVARSIRATATARVRNAAPINFGL